MIRTAATIFAKKTAIVAISGVVIIGGAGLALAADTMSSTGDPTPVTCTDGLVLSADGASCEAPAPLTCTEPQVLSADGTACEDPAPLTCTEPQVLSADGTACEDPAPTAEPEGCVALDTDGTTCLDEEDLGEDVTAEHPENHGKIVSAAAHGEEGSGCEGRTGRDKGQCVSAIARGEEPPALESPAPTPAPAADTEGETEGETADEAPAEEEHVEASTAPAKTNGKPDHAGAGKGGKE